MGCLTFNEKEDVRNHNFSIMGYRQRTNIKLTLRKRNPFISRYLLRKNVLTWVLCHLVGGTPRGSDRVAVIDRKVASNKTIKSAPYTSGNGFW
ncbi:hypothetical protein CN611_30700 [Bacillus wiedmannii]|uniref:Uncharacterized protein n=1 Tax=Bacillus wiedmannii TaxID=1890302 RepID=A0A2B5X6V4_9BACI|nr:hypothetical protein CN611_30700 [Bacillus wiedmannii]PGA91478.1 hypothetical protein COL92_30920 [Bacillus wiedmannii]